MNNNLIAQVDFNKLNGALKGIGFRFAGEKPGKIITDLYPYLFVFAGLALLLYLIMGGFELMISSGEPKKVQNAQEKITNAIIGFIIIFIAFWLVQIIEVILGVKTGIF